MTPAVFRTVIPALSGETDATINAVLALSTPWFNLDRWGAFLTEGLANWVAHNIVTGRHTNAAGMLTAGDATDKQVGSVRVSRGETLLKAQIEDPFMRTVYGQRYRYLARLAGMGGIAAVSGTFTVTA